jgi:hypothetical protein
MTFPTSTAMPVEVSPPPLERYPFGLLSAASVLPMVDTRWEMYGVTYYTADCEVSGGLWLDECLFPDVPADRTKDIAAGLVPVNGVPFLVYDGMACESLGLAEVAPVAENKFAQREQYWVEHTVQAQVLHVNTDVIGPAGPVGLSEGVGLLEKAIAAQYGGVGVIHAARELAAPLTGRYLVRRDGARMRTPMDNLYAFGAGYTTDDPTGAAAAAGQAWLYATGPVVLYRSEVQVREEFDYRKNVRVAVVERSYVATADCLRLAVLVDVSEA